MFGLIGQRHQVVHQLDVLLEVERHAGRTRRQLQVLVALALLGALDAPLDLAHVLEILRHRLAIRRAELQLQARPLRLRDRVEDAAVLLDARQPLGRAAALAEHPLEHLARIDLHRHRRRRRAPRQRVHVDAAVVAVAGADQARVILGRELHRRQQRVLTDLPARRSGRR